MAKKSDFKWHPKMAKLRDSIDKRLDLADVIVEFGKNVTYINTGSTVLNMLIGGTRLPDGSFVCPGWPRGRISEIYGRESSGKSTIALMAVGQAMNEHDGEGTALYVDLEHAVVDSYAMRLGADFRPPEVGGPGRAMRIAPRYAEEVEAIVNDACIQGVDLIVIDSVAGLQCKREIERDVLDVKEKMGIAEVPRFMSNWMPKLQGIIATTGTHVMFLNQTRDKIGAIGYSEEAKKSTTGGNALKFWASNRMSLKTKQFAKAKRYNPLLREFEEVPIATDVAITNIKNKLDARQGHTGLITLRYGVGIDEMRTMMNVATAYDIIRKTKNAKKQEVFAFKLSTGPVIEVVGIEKFRAALKATAGAYEELQNLCIEKILEGMKTIDDEELAAIAEDAVYTKSSAEEDNKDEYVESNDAKEVAPDDMGVNYNEGLQLEV